MAQRNGKRLQKMVNEILDLTKLESNKLELERSKVTWFNYLKLIISNFESIAGAKQINFKFEYLSDKNLMVEIDKEKLETIIYNLLSNAFKFTPNKGSVKFSAKDNGKDLQITISDTGRGIHSDDLPHIFNRFYQTKRNNRKAEGGTGIGLSLVYQLIQLMKGNIEVQSDPDSYREGKGTTFTVSIPKVEIIAAIPDEDYLLLKENEIERNEEKANNLLSSEATNNRLPLTVNRPPSSEKPTILLVEDNLDLRTFIQTLLSTEYNVITAENGQEALHQLSIVNCQLSIVNFRCYDAHHGWLYSIGKA